MKQHISGIVGVLVSWSAVAVEIGPDAVNYDEDVELRQMADRIPSNCRVAGSRDANGQPVFFWQSES